MSVLERRFDDADAAAVIAGKAGQNAAVQASASRRIRLGLTGLAAIFLLVLIAAAGLRPAVQKLSADPQGEPLAVLGVAPGAGPAAAEGARAVPAPRPSST